MGWVERRALLRVALLALALALPVAAGAQQPTLLAFEVTVVLVSPTAAPSAPDPRAQRWDALLGAKLRYESLRVLSTERLSVALDDIATVPLPTGQRFRFRPIDTGAAGVLVSVDMDRSARGDFRIPRGKPLVLGGQPHEDGQMVVILEALAE